MTLLFCNNMLLYKCLLRTQRFKDNVKTYYKYSYFLERVPFKGRCNKDYFNVICSFLPLMVCFHLYRLKVTVKLTQHASVLDVMPWDYEETVGCGAGGNHCLSPNIYIKI